MLNYLNEKKRELLEEKARLEDLNQEHVVNEKVAAYKVKVEAELEHQRQLDLAKVSNKIDVLDELIAEQTVKAEEVVAVEPVEEHIEENIAPTEEVQ